MSTWSELRRRNVFKVGAAYAIMAWLLVQIAASVFPLLLLPSWTATFVAVLLIIGFPVALFLAWAYELTPDGIKPTGSGVQAATVAGPKASRLNVLLVCLLVVAVGYIVVERVLFTPAADGSIARLAVLQCDNLSLNAGETNFAPGIHEELLNRLAQIRNLRLTSRSSVLRFIDPATRPSIPEIGAALDVDAVMECSVRFAGDEMVFTAQLIDAGEDAHLWGDSFPVNMSDVGSWFQVQAELAMNVADAVRVRFFDDEISSIATAPTESSEAYELYLAALSAGIVGERQLNRSIPLIERALEIDEAFADAWIFKGGAYAFRSAIKPAESVAADRRVAMEAFDRALALEPGNPAAYELRGLTLSMDHRWLEGDAAFRRAQELRPALAPSPGYGSFLFAVGHFAQARDSLRRQLESDPLNVQAASFLMMAEELLGNTAASEALNARGQRLHAQWPDLLDAILIPLGQRDLGRLAELPASNPAMQGAAFADVIASLDSPPRALQALRALDPPPQQRTAIRLFVLSAWASFLGDADLALAWWRESFALGGLQHRTWYPVFEPMRRLPGFEAALIEFGLPMYWNVYGWPPTCERLDNDQFDCS